MEEKLIFLILGYLLGLLTVLMIKIMNLWKIKRWYIKTRKKKVKNKIDIE